MSTRKSAEPSILAYQLLGTLSAIGFSASLACHIMGWMQINPPAGKSVFVLHIGIFVVWFPLVIFSNKTKPKSAQNNISHLSAELPKWLRIATQMLFIYAILNFIYFIYCTTQYPKHAVPFAIELRGFSGHWMMFYGAAATGFLALSKLQRKKD